MTNRFDIPKIIHQIWIGQNAEPKLWTDSWRIDYIKNNPDWTYKLWTEKELNELDMINKNLYISEPTLYGKADIARLEIIYKFGGIYIDADSVWVNNKSLNELTEQASNTGVFMAWENTNCQLIANGVIGASIQNEFIYQLIVELAKNFYIKRSRLEPAKVSGPYLIKAIYDKNKNISVFPSHYFYPIYWHNIKDINMHKNIQLNPSSFMFQYGYSTSHLADQMNYFMRYGYRPR